MIEWPNGKVAALSLSFDDGLASQLDLIPVLEKYGVKATFYVVCKNIEKYIPEWKAVAKAGHQIGNHTWTHPCLGSYDCTGENRLENFTLASIGNDIVTATNYIELHLGIAPTTFAYPCGHTFIGRGIHVKSYVPIAAAMFETARGWGAEDGNNPDICDLAYLLCRPGDNKTLGELMSMVQWAKDKNKWLIIGIHEVCGPSPRATTVAAFEEFLKRTTDPAYGVWVETVGAVGKYIRSKRGF